MKTYRVIIHESFEDDTTKKIVYENQYIEQVLGLIETLDGKSFPELEIFLSLASYPYLYIIGGPDMFTFSLVKDKDTWQGTSENPDPDPSKWRTFGLGYPNYEFFDDHLLNKQVTIKAVNHFCMTGEWLPAIPSHIETVPPTS